MVHMKLTDQQPVKKKIEDVMLGFICQDKRGVKKIFFLFVHETIYCWYSLVVPL